jgi:predicted dienelactone hydrolase
MIKFKIFILITLVVTLASCVQAAELPEPRGNYPIGIAYLSFTDQNRPEIFTSDPTDNREITVKAWYPAEPVENAKLAPYIRNAEEIVSIFNLPTSIINIKTHSKLDLSVSRVQETFPVLLFSHGWGEHFSQNTVLMEELASHGYIVFSIAHHYEAKFSFYPDGHFITIDDSSERFLEIMDEQRDPEAFAVFEKMRNAKSYEEQEAVFRQSNELMPKLLVEGPRIWADDISFLIDELENINQDNSLFSGKMNLEQIGVFGMSMGGIASGQVCITDKRCMAGINMDGGIYGDFLDTKISQPFMFMSSERYRGYDNIFSDHVNNSVYTITIHGADHYNFHDLSILDPSFDRLGEIDGYRMLKIINDYTLAFFNKHLKGIDSGLLNDPSSEYPEVEIKVK